MIRLLTRRSLLLVASVLACIGSTHAALSQPIHLRYGQAYSAQRSIFALPMLLAERRGFFLREGLDFHMVPVPGGGTKMIDALHDGTAHIAIQLEPDIQDLVGYRDARFSQGRGGNPRGDGQQMNVSCGDTSG